MEDTELQRLLGHTSLNMTHHYLYPGRNSIKNEGNPRLIIFKITRNVHANKRKHQIHKVKTPKTLILSGF